MNHAERATIILAGINFLLVLVFLFLNRYPSLLLAIHALSLIVLWALVLSPSHPPELRKCCKGFPPTTPPIPYTFIFSRK